MAENNDYDNEFNRKNESSTYGEGRHSMPTGEEPKRRGRGRPRKNPNITVAEANKIERQRRKEEKQRLKAQKAKEQYKEYFPSDDLEEDDDENDNVDIRFDFIDNNEPIAEPIDDIFQKKQEERKEDNHVFEEASKKEVHYHYRKEDNKKKKKIIKIILIIVLILILLLVMFVVGAFVYINSKVNKINYVPIDKSDLSIETTVQEELDEYRNIVILGIDARADTYSEGNRSDGIIIASINEKTGDIKLTSVYRDTYVDIDGHGLDKLTHAYSYGGPQLALKTLNKNFDLNIEEFVAVNFDAIKDIVDSVGGISMNITDEEYKYIKGIEGPGTYVLSGEKALAYARIRYASGGDYKRTERMRDVLTAVFNKVKNFNPRQLNSFIDTTFPHIYTNISADEIKALIPQATKYKISNSIGWPYEVKGITLDRWYGVPVTLESNVQKLHQEVFGQTDYAVSNTVKEISDRIVKKTGYTNE